MKNKYRLLLRPCHLCSVNPHKDFADEPNLDGASLTQAAVEARAFPAPSGSKPAASSAQLVAAAQAALREKTDAEKPAEVSAFEAE